MLVTPLPGVNRDELLAALQNVQSRVENTRGRGADPVERYKAYLQWVDHASRALRGRTREDDIDRLVLTRRCWQLQGMPGGATGPTGGLVGQLVSTELDERVEDLRRACETLKLQIERWSHDWVFTVLDTSFYIHHDATLGHIDFAPLVNAWRAERVHVLVPIVVVDELDNLKRQGKNQARTRARQTLRVLDEHFDPTTPTTVQPAGPMLDSGELPRGEVSIEVVLDPSGHIRLPINDDEIVDRAAAIQALAGRPVTLLTYDTGQAMRARAAGLPAPRLLQAQDDDRSD